MRRIYDSPALSRNDGPFSPRDRDESVRPRSFRSIDGSAWSDRLLPHWLRRRVISVDVSTPQTVFRVGEPVPFTVTMTNPLPIPITIRTRSPVPWTWEIDGVLEASHVSVRNPPDWNGKLHFDRGERIRFRKHWPQRFRVSDREWEPATPGEYTITATIDVDSPDRNGLTAETTVRIEP